MENFARKIVTYFFQKYAYMFTVSNGTGVET